jgi:hypothetical protein
MPIMVAHSTFFSFVVVICLCKAISVPHGYEHERDVRNVKTDTPGVKNTWASEAGHRILFLDPLPWRMPEGR